MRIIFSDWVIALDKGRLPRQYDDGEPLEVINAPPEWVWTLNAQMGDSLDVIPLSATDGVVGTTLSKSQLALAGDYRLQLAGAKDGVTRHTNIISMAVPKSLSGDATWPTLPTAFSDAVGRAEDAAERAESAVASMAFLPGSVVYGKLDETTEKILLYKDFACTVNVNFQDAMLFSDTHNALFVHGNKTYQYVGAEEVPDISGFYGIIVTSRVEVVTDPNENKTVKVETAKLDIMGGLSGTRDYVTLTTAEIPLTTT